MSCAIQLTQVYRLLVLGEKEWAYFLVTYLMTILATYLTGVWGLSITHASQIMNIYSGTVFILPVVMNKTLRSCMGSLIFTVLISQVAFILGLVLLTSSASGICGEDKVVCINSTKKILFYTGLFFLAGAMPTHETWSKQYLDSPMQQLMPQFQGYASLIFPIGALVTIGYVTSWSIKFLIPTICAVLYFCQIPRFDNDNSEEHDQYQDLNDNESSRQARHSFSYACFCATLVSVVFTVGNTFFILQAVDLSPKLWFVTISIALLPVIKESVKVNVGCLTYRLFPFGLGASMVFVTLCCVTAALVETRRLSVVVSEGVVDDSDTIIPMTIFWLVPQYVLLGLAELTLDDHLQHELKQVTENSYVIGKVIRAAGFYCGVLLVYVVGIIRPSWIQETVNTSQLDSYYWFLAAISAVNLLLFILITTIILLCTNE